MVEIKGVMARMESLRERLLPLLRLMAKVRVRMVRTVKEVRAKVMATVREGTVPLLVLEPNLNVISVRNLGVLILIIVSVPDATSAASSAMSIITANTVRPIRSTL